MLLLRRLIPYSTIAPACKLPNLRQMYVLIWRTTRGGWTQSEVSSNHHRLVRVLKRPDSSVPRTRGRGRKDEPSLTAICSLTWDRTKVVIFFLPRRNAWTRGPSELLRQHLQTSLHQRNTLVRELGQLQHRQNAGTRQLAKNTSNLTPVEKERRHRFRTRL